MNQVFNFSAGPATLSDTVLRTIHQELFNKDNSGMSVMEMSHRSKAFDSIINKTKADLISLLNIPKNYEVLFLQGGASLQFAMVPMNLLKTSKKAAIIHTGVWSDKAISEAARFGSVDVIASGEDAHFKKLPTLKQDSNVSQADYVHYVSNNTVYCTQFKNVPLDHHTLVCDMSSDICSKPIDVSQYGIIFAGAQKNLGIAGLTLVIIRKDLLQTKDLNLPSMLDYNVHAKKNSMFNTPPTFSLYVCGLVLEWIKDVGGLEKMQELNNHKANLLYKAIDESSLFINDVHAADRSMMNVSFTTNNEDLDTQFIDFAKEYGCVNIKGHRLVKGCRASLYNAMPIEGVKKLIETMQAFEDKMTKEGVHA